MGKLIIAHFNHTPHHLIVEYTKNSCTNQLLQLPLTLQFHPFVDVEKVPDICYNETTQDTIAEIPNRKLINFLR